jgi:hypothetical protein
VSRRVGQVGHDDQRWNVLCTDFGGDLIRGLDTVSPVDDQRSAGCRQLERDGSSNPCRRSGDHSGLAKQFAGQSWGS